MNTDLEFAFEKLYEAVQELESCGIRIKRVGPGVGDLSFEVDSDDICLEDFEEGEQYLTTGFIEHDWKIICKRDY